MTSLLFNELRGCCPCQWDSLLVFSEQPSGLTLAWDVWRFHGTPSTKNSTTCNPVLPREALPNYERWLVRTLYPRSKESSLESPNRFQEISTVVGFYIVFQMHPQFQSSPPVSPPFLSQMNPPVLIPNCSSSFTNSVVFPLLREIHVFLLSPSFYNLSGSVDYSLVIIYLTTNIHIFIST